MQGIIKRTEEDAYNFQAMPQLLSGSMGIIIIMVKFIIVYRSDFSAWGYLL